MPRARAGMPPPSLGSPYRGTSPIRNRTPLRPEDTASAGREGPASLGGVGLDLALQRVDRPAVRICC